MQINCNLNTFEVSLLSKKEPHSTKLVKYSVDLILGENEQDVYDRNDYEIIIDNSGLLRPTVLDIKFIYRSEAEGINEVINDKTQLDMFNKIIEAYNNIYGTKELILDYSYETMSFRILPKISNLSQDKLKLLFKNVLENNNEILKFLLSENAVMLEQMHGKGLFQVVMAGCVPVWVHSGANDIFYAFKDKELRQQKDIKYISSVVGEYFISGIYKSQDKDIKGSRSWELIPTYVFKKLNINSVIDLVDMYC